MRESFRRYRRERRKYQDGLLLPILGGTAGLTIVDYGFLAMLMELQLANNENDADGGWWQCRDEDVRSHSMSALAPSSITRAMQKIERAGFIKTRREGKPPTRRIWIDFDRIESSAAKFEEKLRDAESRGY